MMSNLKIYTQSSSKAIDRQKTGEGRNRKIWVSWEWKELSRWNKNNFSYLFKGYHMVKKWKIGDTSVINYQFR